MNPRRELKPNAPGGLENSCNLNLLSREINGSKGTAMAPFIPLILTEEEAWQVLRYVRSFGQP